MATYVSKRCPNCNRLISYGTQRQSQSFGSPVCVCNYCKKIYIDKSIHEVAIKGPDYYRNFMPYWVKIGMLFFGFWGIISLIGDWYRIGFICTIAFFVFFMIYAHIRDTHPNPRHMTREVIEASEKRLSKPEYALFLKRHGYDIPQKYLKD